MSMRIITAAGLMVFALALQGCTNTQPAYYGTYPSDFEFGPNHGYEPYASAPYDPYGTYYQNFAPATPYYYEPPESHRDCDQRPCIAYRRHAETPALEPKIIALPTGKQSFHPPSTISRPSHAASAPSGHPQHADGE
jgi:hypothetical protein